MRPRDVGPWALVPGWVIRRCIGAPKYGREALSLYCEIAIRAEREHQSWTISRSDLAGALGCSADTISRWAKVLTDCGAIDVAANLTADGDRGWNTYRVFITDPDASSAGEVAADLAPPPAPSDGVIQEPLDKNPSPPRKRGGRGPRPETTARRDEANAIVKAWWEWHQAQNEGHAPTAVAYVGCVTIVEKLLAAGYGRTTIKNGLVDAQRTSTISVGAIEIAIKRRITNAPQARMVRDDHEPDHAPRSGWEREST